MHPTCRRRTFQVQEKYMGERELPAGIGPHEEKELELMLAAKKDVAKFFDFIPAAFVPYLQSGRFHYLVDFQNIDGGFAYPTFIIYRPEARGKAEELASLLTPQLLTLDETHRRIGRILGYEEWQIEAFLQHSAVR